MSGAEGQAPYLRGNTKTYTVGNVLATDSINLDTLSGAASSRIYDAKAMTLVVDNGTNQSITNVVPVFYDTAGPREADINYSVAYFNAVANSSTTWIVTLSKGVLANVKLNITYAAAPTSGAVNVILAFGGNPNATNIQQVGGQDVPASNYLAYAVPTASEGLALYANGYAAFAAGNVQTTAGISTGSLAGPGASVFDVHAVTVVIVNNSNQTITAASLMFFDNIGTKAVQIIYPITGVNIAAGTYDTFYVPVTKALQSDQVTLTFAAAPTAGNAYVSFTFHGGASGGSGSGANPAQDGTDATGVAPPAGATGIRGWLSSIYNLFFGGTATVKMAAQGATGAATPASALLMGGNDITSTISAVRVSNYFGKVDGIDPNTYPALLTAAYQLGWSGNGSMVRLRVAGALGSPFYGNLVNGGASPAVFTPVAGWKFRMMAVVVSVSIATRVQLTDAGTVIADHDFAAGTTVLKYPGNGRISAAANNVFGAQIPAGAANASVGVELYGTQE